MMKTKAIRRILGLLAMFPLVWAIGCERPVDDLNKAVAVSLDERGRSIYKSEIQRTRVHYDTKQGLLVYTFWKHERFMANGSLFLHLYPKDIGNLPAHRKDHGFFNIPISEKELVPLTGGYYYLLKPLRDVGSIRKMVTGQYRDGKRKWQVEYTPNDTAAVGGPFEHTNRYLNELKKREGPKLALQHRLLAALLDGGNGNIWTNSKQFLGVVPALGMGYYWSFSDNPVPQIRWQGGTASNGSPVSLGNSPLGTDGFTGGIHSFEMPEKWHTLGLYDTNGDLLPGALIKQQ